MLTINNQHYASNNSEFINSLFAKDGTCAGYYKRLKKDVFGNPIVIISDIQDKPVFAIIDKCIVACCKVNNRYRYSYCLDEMTCERYNIPLSLAKQYEIVQHIYSQIGN